MRIPPVGPPQAYQTYQVATPLATHWSAATCAQVDCEHYLNGWGLRLEALSPEDLHLAKTSGRRYRVVEVAEGETWLAFEPGQPCFQAGAHMRRLEREGLFVVRGGDHRGDPSRRTPMVLTPQDWTGDFSEHQDAIVAEIERLA